MYWIIDIIIVLETFSLGFLIHRLLLKKGFFETVPMGTYMMVKDELDDVKSRLNLMGEDEETPVPSFDTEVNKLKPERTDTENVFSTIPEVEKEFEEKTTINQEKHLHEIEELKKGYEDALLKKDELLATRASSGNAFTYGALMRRFQESTKQLFTDNRDWEDLTKVRRNILIAKEIEKSSNKYTMATFWSSCYDLIFAYILTRFIEEYRPEMDIAEKTRNRLQAFTRLFMVGAKLSEGGLLQTLPTGVHSESELMDVELDAVTRIEELGKKMKTPEMYEKIIAESSQDLKSLKQNNFGALPWLSDGFIGAILNITEGDNDGSGFSPEAMEIHSLLLAPFAEYLRKYAIKYEATAG